MYVMSPDYDLSKAGITDDVVVVFFFIHSFISALYLFSNCFPFNECPYLRTCYKV